MVLTLGGRSTDDSTPETSALSDGEAIYLLDLGLVRVLEVCAASPHMPVAAQLRVLQWLDGRLGDGGHPAVRGLRFEEFGPILYSEVLEACTAIDKKLKEAQEVKVECPSCRAIGMTTRVEGLSLTVACDACGAMASTTDPTAPTFRNYHAFYDSSTGVQTRAAAAIAVQSGVSAREVLRRIRAGEPVLTDVRGSRLPQLVLSVYRRGVKLRIEPPFSWTAR